MVAEVCSAQDVLRRALRGVAVREVAQATRLALKGEQQAAKQGQSPEKHKSGGRFPLTFSNWAHLAIGLWEHVAHAAQYSEAHGGLVRER